MTVWVPLLAGALLLISELGFSFHHGAKMNDEGRRRILWAAGAGLGGMAVSAVVLLAATVPIGRSVPITITGAVAAVLAVASVSFLARR